ncbi:MAG: hypothetical protein AAFY27_06265 [Pseudomonadota bacterium]
MPARAPELGAELKKIGVRNRRAQRKITDWKQRQHLSVIKAQKCVMIEQDWPRQGALLQVDGGCPPLETWQAVLERIKEKILSWRVERVVSVAPQG